VDTVITDLLDLKHRQPSASLADLCTLMVLRTPHGSLGWAKVPCDYPTFRAGLLCKRPAQGKEGRARFSVTLYFSGSLITTDSPKHIMFFSSDS